MSVMDLLQDLAADHKSEAGEWKRLYDVEVARGNKFFERLSDTDCKLTICEGQRASLIGFVLTACTLLEVSWPGTANGLRQKVVEMETEYAKPLPPLKSFGPRPGTAAGGSPNKAGSSAVPQAETQLEGPERLSVSNCAPITYAGEWDEVKP